MLKIFSWNVNGLRAVLRKGAFQEFIKKIKFILRKLLYNDKLLDILIIAILFHTTGV